MKLKIDAYIDGASRGNPGPSAVGIFIRESSGEDILRRGEFIGQTTNNVAEYTALIRMLKHLNKLLKQKPADINIYSDSELLVNQMNGDYRIKSEHLIPLAIEARKLMKAHGEIKLNLITREHNKIADKLANKALNTEASFDE
ncbi:MAG: ribonuclease HI family protein [Planctomycetes bacterium]|nr:ribonuclease HI family protein [Planctomycetota bacterium]